MAQIGNWVPTPLVRCAKCGQILWRGEGMRADEIVKTCPCVGKDMPSNFMGVPIEWDNNGKQWVFMGAAWAPIYNPLSIPEYN